MAAQSLLVAGAETALGNISRAGDSALAWAPGAVGVKALDIVLENFISFQLLITAPQKIIEVG